MKKIILALSASVLMLGSMTSCKKEGCTDSYATNYDEKADKDNGTCTYTASVQFWYNKSTSDALVALGVTNLKYYIDNQLIGSTAADVFFTGDPSCTQSNVIRKSVDLGTSVTKSFTYKIVDDAGDVLWEGTDKYDGTKSCYSIQLTR